MLLHTVNKAPWQSPALELCLRLAAPGDTVLLIEDGVLAAVTGGPWAARLADAAPRVLVLLPDLILRGLEAHRHLALSGVDYPGFVDLCCASDNVQSWT